MKQFQKIAIGLLGLTNPEMFIERPKPNVTAGTEVEADSGLSSTGSGSSREGRVMRLIRAIKSVGAALAIGPRRVALGARSPASQD
jgi:hypothetical protein